MRDPIDFALFLLQRFLIVLVSLLVLVYAGDYGLARYRASANSTALYGSVDVQRVDEVPLKSGKTGYYPEASETDTCIHSIFPHFGYTPCWYLTRHPRRIIPITIIPSSTFVTRGPGEPILRNLPYRLL